MLSFCLQVGESHEGLFPSPYQEQPLSVQKIVHGPPPTPLDVVPTVSECNGPLAYDKSQVYETQVGQIVSKVLEELDHRRRPTGSTAVSSIP